MRIDCGITEADCLGAWFVLLYPAQAQRVPGGLPDRSILRLSQGRLRRTKRTHKKTLKSGPRTPQWCFCLGMFMLFYVIFRFSWVNGGESPEIWDVFPAD